MSPVAIHGANGWLLIAFTAGVVSVACGNTIIRTVVWAALLMAAVLALEPTLPMVTQSVLFVALWGIHLVAVLHVPTDLAEHRRNTGRRLESATPPPIRVGSHVVVESEIRNGSGSVRANGQIWRARGPDASSGTWLRVVSVEDGTITVANLLPSSQELGRTLVRARPG